MLTSNKNEEQMTEINQDDGKVTENNPLSFVNKKKVTVLLPKSNDQNGITTHSVGVGRDNESEVKDTEEETKDSTVTDEYTYDGDTYENKKHGKGVLSWSDGRTYTGAFFADKRHGFGTFHTSDISEFKGLYCHDERFGPGILFYKTMENADVGLWLNEYLIRLLTYPTNLPFEIEITEKKSSECSSLTIPSWYSPQELFQTVNHMNNLLKTKCSTLFCNKIQYEKNNVSQYITEHIDRLEDKIKEKRAQIDAYLTSIYQINDDHHLKEKISNDRQADIISPNQTYEQQQLYYYANKFWPLKQRALFPIDEIISNRRSSFPKAGPLENGSLKLYEYSYHGQENELRDLLIQRSIYVDVCDSRGLTALYYAIYNAHLNILNILLDSGANINQLSDQSLTPLSLAFLLYYGNNPQQTINTALEHRDPVILNPRRSVTSSSERERNGSVSSKYNFTDSSTSSVTNLIDEQKLPSAFESIKLNHLEKKNSYGYELTDYLRQRIRDEEFRQLIYSVIVLLLRRGADPSYSDWPLPVLALAVRSADIHMVELLLKKKVEVNCQLSRTRHWNLTPLHIACGCLATNSVDIAKLLLEHGAFVNAQSYPGNNEYLSLIDPLVIENNKLNEIEQQGRTPLHIVCSRKETVDTINLVRLLLEYNANPNAVCNGQTPLTLAIILGNQTIVDILLNNPNTDPSTVLGLGNGNALSILLSTFHEPRWTYNKRLQLIERLISKTPKVLYPIRFGPKNTLGSIVDFTYFMHSADSRISKSPYHTLSSEERNVFNQRKELINYVATRFREEVTKYEDFLRLPTPTSDNQTHSSSPMNFYSRTPTQITGKTSDGTKTSGDFRFCATCGRSTGVRLEFCKRCQKVSFCSKTCKVNGWNQFHRYQCQRSTSPTSTFRSSPLQNKNLSNLDRVVTTKPPPKTSHSSSRLPPVSVAKLLQQKRLKARGKSAGNLPSKYVSSLEGIKLSWNTMYNAPENYSFN